ncbi:hypothetical protein PUNSTDRAFT_115551 [Punctularia strigosozonata HHB-11173 SS5]|uniref:uncharacterized protein n=1 Tax=Punctularia strigosozonata (strain HHB-11173) TaxID=741275 RepID=UPI0004416B00|nr:uncharacterized protein PUNSTDRAFT_115551 [Punctularia strigosozonata HHB-11173 SS5]EIN06248.1 hypothetical protein PUNSTDRAFT_115551 [Punctularia strigosozonata HHB-11173 SS5]
MSNGSIPSPPQRDVILDVYDDQVNAIKKLTPWGAAGIYIKTEKTAENCMNLFSQELPLYKDHLSADTFDALEKTKLRVSTARDSLVSKLKRAREVTGEPFWKKPILVVTRSRDEIHAYRELTETFREVLMTASREARDKHRRAEVFAAVVHEEDMERNHIVTEMHESRNRNKTSQSSDRQENIDIPSNGTSPTRYDLAAIYNSKTGQYTDCNGNPLLHAPGAEPVRNAIIQACSQHLAREEALLQSDTKMGTLPKEDVASPMPRREEIHLITICPRLNLRTETMQIL